jgi:23S rRNA (uracil1939-C5)-methyltransferase
LPGEIVTGTLEAGRLTDLRIVRPSSDRVAPPCPHYKACGACQLQHASDAFEAAWKADAIRQALSARGLTTDIRPIQTSPPATRRRAAFAARRTKKGALAGFHARHSDVITPVPDCRVVVPELREALPLAERLATLGASRKQALAVLVTASGAGLDVSIEGGKPLDGPLLADVAQIAQAANLARISWGGDIVATRRPPVQQFDGIAVVPPPGAFLQATWHGENALRTAVTEAVSGATRLADLFAGCGTFALPLARASEVHAVEGAADMVRALDQAWRQTDGLKHVAADTRDLFRRPLTPDELTRFDAVVLDPPRAGAAAQVAELARARVPRLAYVSCNPVSFSRDAGVLVDAGYHLDWVQPVDQFRWSCHVELVGQFSQSLTRARPKRRPRTQ